MTGTPKGRNATKAATSAIRPAPAGGLEQEAQHHEGQIDSGDEGQELLFGHSALYRQVADPEGDDQDVEHEHDRVQLSDEQPAVDTEAIGGEGADAEPGQPQ
jgi:hypothetical protein